jgi:hypothetical protein
LTLMSLPDYVAVGDELVYCVSLRLGASESYRCRSVSVALIAVRVTAPEAVFVSTCGADGLLYEECVTVGADYTLPQAAACDGEAQFVGWWVQGTAEDGLYPAGATITIGTSAVVLTAAYVHLRVLPGAAVVEKDGAPALRFDGAIRLEDYERLTAITTVELGMLAVPVGEQPHFTDVVCDTIRPSRGEAYLVVCGQTDALAGENLTRNFYGTIGLRVQYADGGECVLTAVRDEESGVRCLRDVARAALADSDAMYAPTLRTLLQNIVQ